MALVKRRLAGLHISMAGLPLREDVVRFDHYQTLKKILNVKETRFLPPIHEFPHNRA
jgi:hypothetical protein